MLLQKVGWDNADIIGVSLGGNFIFFIKSFLTQDTLLILHQKGPLQHRLLLFIQKWSTK